MSCFVASASCFPQTSNRAWAEELARKAPELLPKLQAQLGGPTVVRSLSFTVKP